MPKEPRLTNNVYGNIESLEERLAMTADPLVGVMGSGADAGTSSAPPMELHAANFEAPALEQHSAIDDAIAFEHHSAADALPPLEHLTFGDGLPPLDTFAEDDIPSLVEHSTTPDFWRDHDFAASDDLGERVEQTLTSAHGTTGWNTVRTNYGFTGIGQTVAVIDSGIAYDHYALGGGLGEGYRVVGGWDFTEENDADPYNEQGGHGTHVAGIIGSDDATHQGVAPGVDLVGLRVFNDDGAGYFTWVENALQWVHDNRDSFENPITTVNLSLGVSSWNADSIPSWANLEEEFAQLEADGIFIAVSAGNSYNSFNTTGLSYPAASQYVVPVMSVDDGGGLSHYSQRHQRAIGAPGRNITSTVPDHDGNNNGSVDDFGAKSGTSMAAPYLAGASVLVREAMEFVGQTNLTQDDIFDHIKETADSFFDSATNQNYDRLNLGAAIAALMPEDDFGSSVQTAFSLGNVDANTATTMSGVISTLDDADYFTFVADVTGTVDFTATNATHQLDVTWSVDGGTWHSDGADGESCIIDVVAGNTYTVGIASDDGLGYFDVDITAEASETINIVDWGAFTQGTMANVDVADDGWYRVEATRDGYLTVNTSFNAAGGNVTLEIYDATGTNVLGAGGSRVDINANAGDSFLVRAIGTNADVDFTITNLVEFSGGVVSVDGTAGDDAFEFSRDSVNEVVVNGIRYAFQVSSSSTFNFNGGGGSDDITITGTAGDETATLSGTSVQFSGSAFEVNAVGMENASLIGNGGNDAVEIFDTGGDDVFAAYADRAEMTLATGQVLEAIGFSDVRAYASQGLDRAHFYDTAGDEVFRSYHDKATMTGAGFSNYGSGFDESFAYATTGNDRAMFHDSAGNETFRGYSHTVTMTGAAFFAQATSFDEVYAYSTGGTDTAVFNDSAGDDTFRANSTTATMTGDGYFHYARDFSENYAFGGVGYDRAILDDSAGDDTFRTFADRAMMQGDGYFNFARGFAESYGFATVGNDRVVMTDSAGNDTFRAYHDKSTMHGNGFFHYARGFDESYAFSTGGIDRAVFYDSLGNDTYRAYSNKSTMSGTGFFNYAGGFAKAEAYGSTGDDVAFLYDSAGGDSLVASNALAQLYGDGFDNEVHNFDNITAISNQGGTDDTSVGATDYALSLIGDWD
ncbi:S8 family serine peptidase [Pirellulales bacterium]|nr:S8 family serine peptidase [Pirellulales bacterium]